MIEKYPFFREESEKTRAVIGENAAVSDLNGAFQSPYAVLTEKRLYLKNERGNFIVDADNIKGADMPLSLSYTFKLPLIAFGLNAVMFFYFLIDLAILYFNNEYIYFNIPIIMIDLFLMLILPSLFFFVRKKAPNIAPFFLIIGPLRTVLNMIRIIYLGIIEHITIDFNGRIGSFIFFNILAVSIILLVASFYLLTKNKSNMFIVYHKGGILALPSKYYPVSDLRNFKAQVNALRSASNGK